MTAALLTATALAMPGHAQQSDGQTEPVDTDEVIVTAERTARSIQTTPISITAVDGNDLATRGIASLEGLTAAVPNLTFGNQLGTPNVSIRGIGLSTLSTGQESNIAFNIDGVYLGRPAAAQAGLFDIERVEVLRGPQGTLYGRNATGGSINVITKRPKHEVDGYATLSYGEDNRLEILGAIGGGLSDRVRARIAGRFINRDGFGTNITTGNDLFDEQSYALRGSLDIDLSTNWMLALTADLYEQDDASGGYSYLRPGNPAIVPLAIVPANQPGLFGGLGGSTGGGGSVFNGSNVFDESFDSDPHNDRSYTGFLAHLSGELGAASVHSRTAYRSTDYEISSDIDGANVLFASISQTENADQFSQELQFDGSIGRRIDWVLGAYYFNEEVEGSTVIPQPFNFPAFTGGVGNVYIARGTIETDAWALFGNARFAVTDTINLVAGLRYSSEDKSLDNFGQVTAFGPPVVGQFDKSFDALTPRFVAEYRPNRNVFVYASATRGFKSGGFDLGSQAPDPSYNAEYIWSYELGGKFKFGDGLGNLNLTGFFGDYSDLQVGRITGLTLVIENAAQATVKGFEAELNLYPTERLALYANATSLRANFDEFLTDDAVTGATALNLKGNALPQAPRFTLQLGANYSHPLANGASLQFDINARHTAKQYFSPFNRANAEVQPSYVRGDASITYAGADESYSIGVYARNLGEKNVLTNSFVSAFLFGFPEFGFYAPPRQLGITVSKRF